MEQVSHGEIKHNPPPDSPSRIPASGELGPAPTSQAAHRRARGPREIPPSGSGELPDQAGAVGGGRVGGGKTRRAARHDTKRDDVWALFG